MAKARRAPSGSWDVIQRVREIVQETSPTEAAKLLGVSRRYVYKMRIATAAKQVVVRPSTLRKWEARLQASGAKVLAQQARAIEAGRQPPRSASEAARLISAASGEEWTYQGVTAAVREIEKRPPDYIGIGAPPTGPPPTGPPPIGAPPITRWEDEGVRFMTPGEQWSTAQPLIEPRETFMTYEEAKDYVQHVFPAKQVLVVIQVWNDDIGAYEYEVWLDYEEA